LNDIPFFKIIFINSLKKYYGTKKKFIKIISDTLEDYYKHDKKLKSFLSYILEYYENTCEIFYEELYKKIGLKDFTNTTFIKIL
jgi:hypothetical protein